MPEPKTPGTGDACLGSSLAISSSRDNALGDSDNTSVDDAGCNRAEGNGTPGRLD
jgi:hypothetical protein